MSNGIICQYYATIMMEVEAPQEKLWPSSDSSFCLFEVLMAVLLFVCVFLQSFLKELPDSLLVTELYDKWMAAFDNEDVQQRAVGLRR